MSNYSEHEDQVRVDFFKPSGKWYCTEAVKWVSYHGCIHTAFKASLDKHFDGEARLDGMTAVCLAPYHEHAHPIMMTID